jgi:hypothetical protein
MGPIVQNKTLVVLLIFIILSLVFTYPLPLHLGSAVEDRQDALLNVWITAWDGHQLLADPLHLFDANIFHPYPRTLAYSELLLGNALLALPLSAATGNPVLGYNVALLLSFALSALGAYLLVRRLTRSAAAGVVAGLIFAFSSYRMTNVAQAQLLTTQWMPFALLALYELIHRSRPRHAALFVLFFSLQALSSFYYGILLALVVVAYGLWAVAVRRRKPRVRLPLLALLGISLVLVPFSLPYFRVQEEMGFRRTLADSEPFSASLKQYLMVPARSPLHGRWLPSDDTPIAGGYPVDALFPGLVALGLAGVGLLRGRGRERWFFALLALAAFLLSLGPRLYLAPGRPADVDVTLPYAWLYALVPGFEALRAPVRFDALVSLALAVLAGYGLLALVGHGRRRRAAPLLLAGLVLVESFVWPGATAEPVPVGEDVPQVYRWLAGQVAGPAPIEGPILELPMAFTEGGPQLEYQYLSTYHWRTTPDGYSGFVPPEHGQIVYEMERFPSERSVSLLQALGVRTAVVHAARYMPDRWQEMEAALLKAGDLAPVTVLGTDHVYEVRPRDFPPDDLQIYVYLPPRAAAGGDYTAYVVALNWGARSYALRPTDELQVTVQWQGAGDPVSGEATADVPLVTSPMDGAAVIALPLPAPEPAGVYRLSLAAAGGPLGRWAWQGTVEMGDAGDSAFPVPVRLDGWTVPAAARPGGPLQVDLTWLALGKIDAYYSVYVKLLDGEGNAVAGWDGQPRDGQAPTLLWTPGEAVDDRVTLDVPAGLSPGEYRLVAGMYRAEDLARCLTLDEEGQPVAQVTLGTVRVEP